MQTDKNTAVRDLMQFLDSSPVNFYAVHTIAARLDAEGFKRLDPADKWTLEPGGRYYITKNGSAIFGFVVGAGPASAGYHIISAHSDSPTMRVKPAAVMVSDGGVVKLNVEVYGGPILSTWMDRPLSLAGRVALRSDNPLRPRLKLVKWDRPLLTIPNLAIHFNRQVNDGVRLSPQKDMLPVLGIADDKGTATQRFMEMIAEAAGASVEDILDFDLSLYDTTPACLTGMDSEFVTSGRLDDLSMCHAALDALVSTASESVAATRVMAIFANEETGSGTKQGAASPVLRSLLERVTAAKGGSHEDYLRAVENSFMVSADNAHAFHPNYGEKYDPTNHPVPGGGPVIKINARCKYMTDADSAAVFKGICEAAGVPCQYFVNHSDVAGGSTLGNILTSQIPLRGVDMGEAIWAMHSVRETAAAADHWHTIRAFRKFFQL